VYSLFIYLVGDGVGGVYSRRLCHFLRTRRQRRSNRTYCIKCVPPRATPASSPRQAQSSLPRRSVGFSPPRIARSSPPSLALRMLSAGERSGKKSHGACGRWTRMDDGGWCKGILYDSYVRTHRRVFFNLDFGLWGLASEPI
jgi:hypothetical protein